MDAVHLRRVHEDLELGSWQRCFPKPRWIELDRNIGLPIATLVSLKVIGPQRGCDSTREGRQDAVFIDVACSRNRTPDGGQQVIQGAGSTGLRDRGVELGLEVLDEPTHGLDIIFRKEFYSNLLNDYFDDERTIIITTHQVEEIENLLTDVMFINHGRVVLDSSMDSIPDTFVELLASSENAAKAERFQPIFKREVFGQRVLTFEGVDRGELESLGEVRTPDIADLFVAKVKGEAA